MNHPHAHLTLALVTGLVIGACGGGGGDPAPTAPNPPAPQSPGTAPQTAQVAMQSGSDGYGYESHAFQPSRVEVARGGSVTWSNNTSFTHNVTFSTAGAPANIADHSSGNNTRTFATTGVFDYRCTLHSGMAGQVSVR